MAANRLSGAVFPPRFLATSPDGRFKDGREPWATSKLGSSTSSNGFAEDGAAALLGGLRLFEATRIVLILYFIGWTFVIGFD